MVREWLALQTSQILPSPNFDFSPFLPPSDSTFPISQIFIIKIVSENPVFFTHFYIQFFLVFWIWIIVFPIFDSMDATSSSLALSNMKLPGSNKTLNSDHRVSTLCSLPNSGVSFSSKSSGNLQVRAKSTGLVVSCSSSNGHRDVMQGLHLSVPIEKRSRLGQAFCSVGTFTVGEFALESHSQAVDEKVGVLLLNLGGPETLDDVQPFLYNLFADPDIIRLPRLFRFLQEPLAQLISTFRAPKSKEGYASIGGGSPLRKITDEQAQALKMALEEKNISANVYVGMRYWYPFTEEAIQQIKRDAITRLVVLPLYPQYSISTTGSSIRVLQKMFREDAFLSTLPVSIIKSWYQREGYIKSMADLIQGELKKFANPQEVMIFFSAHGVPVSYVENAGDPYRDEMEECIYLIMQELKARGIGNEHTLAYQSRVGPVQWLKPYTDEVLVELGQKGIKSLLAVPVSFVSEHIETLEEIDMEYKHLALESGIKNWGRVPALNCKSSFILDLADAVIEALPSATALSPQASSTDADDRDPFQYAIKLLFGSILAFVLLLSPKAYLAFRNNFL